MVNITVLKGQVEEELIHYKSARVHSYMSPTSLPTGTLIDPAVTGLAVKFRNKKTVISAFTRYGQ